MGLASHPRRPDTDAPIFTNCQDKLCQGNHMKKPPSKEYLEYMQSNAWDDLRKFRLFYDSYTCQDCGVTGKPLDVHHLTYDRFGHEFIDDVVSLCRTCHNFRHGKVKIAFMNCPTCLQFLPVTIQKIKLMKHDLIKYVCADGHVRTYNDTYTD